MQVDDFSAGPMVKGVGTLKKLRPLQLRNVGAAAITNDPEATLQYTGDSLRFYGARLNSLSAHR